MTSEYAVILILPNGDRIGQIVLADSKAEANLFAEAATGGKAQSAKLVQPLDKGGE